MNAALSVQPHIYVLFLTIYSNIYQLKLLTIYNIFKLMRYKSLEYRKEALAVTKVWTM